MFIFSLFFILIVFIMSIWEARPSNQVHTFESKSKVPESFNYLICYNITHHYEWIESEHRYNRKK